MKYIDITFNDGYFYDRFGNGRRTIAYMKKNGEIYERYGTLGPSMILAYFDASTGDIYKNKTVMGNYWSRIARIERCGDVYKGEKPAFGQGEFAGRLYSSEVEKIYAYLDVTQNVVTPKKEENEGNKPPTKGNKPPTDGPTINILAILGCLFLGALFLFCAFGIYGEMADSKFSEYWWHALLMVGAFAIMFSVPAKAKIDDYYARYFGYTAITSLILIIGMLFASGDSFGDKLILVIFTPILLAGSFSIPAAIGTLINKAMKD